MKHSSLKIIHPGKEIPILPIKTNYIQNPFLGFGILWNVFKFYGIDFCFTGTEKGKLRLFLMKAIPFIQHLALAYHLFASFTVVYHNPYELIYIIPFSLSSLISILLWHTLYKKKIHKKKLLNQFFKNKMLLEEYITSKENRDSLYVNLSIVVGFLVPITSALNFTLMHTDPESPTNLYYSFFIRFPNNTATGPLVRTVTSQSIYGLLYTFPALTSTLCSVTYYKYGSLVRDYSVLLKNFRFSDSSEKILLIAKVHKMIYDVGHDLDELLSSVVFLLLCNQVVVMYVTLSTLVSAGQNVVPSWVWECLPAMTVVPLSVVIQVLCAGRVSRKFSEVSVVLKAAQDRLVAEGNLDSYVLKLIRLFRDEPYPQMTAWGVVKLKTSFIFTIFGSLFTYGLLVVNLDRELLVPGPQGDWKGV